MTDKRAICPACKWPFHKPASQEDRQFCRACESAAEASVNVESFRGPDDDPPYSVIAEPFSD
jgi:hypothetical protein